MRRARKKFRSSEPTIRITTADGEEYKDRLRGAPDNEAQAPPPPPPLGEMRFAVRCSRAAGGCSFSGEIVYVISTECMRHECYSRHGDDSEEDSEEDSEDQQEYIVCNFCDSYKCMGCAADCERCESSPLCKSCVSYCERCEMSICRGCSDYCETCDEPLCKGHGVEWTAKSKNNCYSTCDECRQAEKRARATSIA